MFNESNGLIVLTDHRIWIRPEPGQENCPLFRNKLLDLYILTTKFIEKLLNRLSLF